MNFLTSHLPLIAGRGGGGGGGGGDGDLSSLSHCYYLLDFLADC